MSGTRWAIALAAGALLVTLPFWIWDLDLAVSGLFYDAESNAWPKGDAAVYRFLYDYGEWPGWALFWIGLAGLFAAIGIRALRSRVRFFAFSVLLLLLGPLLLVNVIFKPGYGRPRPRDVVEFGGDRAYLRPLVPGEERGTSFPSGHASMGFIWLGFAVYYHAARPHRAWLFAGLGVVHGALLGLTRIAQGGHFLSDVLWSAIFILIAAVILYYPVGLRPPPARAASYTR